jgi:FKBP-type peptidyl-prolyl cis-trans isomerase
MARNSILRANAVRPPQLFVLMIGKPFTTTIGIGRVIKGWDEAVPKMTLGEKARLTITPYDPSRFGLRLLSPIWFIFCMLTISSDYGYGADGYPPVIPPSSTLIFDVELLGINGKQA